MKLFGRGKDAVPAGGGSTVIGRTGARRGKSLRRLVSAVLLLGILAAFTRPGRRGTRRPGGRRDSGGKFFAEPGSSRSARVFPPLLGPLSGSVARDVARERTPRRRN